MLSREASNTRNQQKSLDLGSVIIQMEEIGHAKDESRGVWRGALMQWRHASSLRRAGNATVAKLINAAAAQRVPSKPPAIWNFHIRPISSVGFVLFGLLR